MNNNQQFTLLDILNILSFVIGIMNYEENLTQGDKQELMEQLDRTTQILIDRVGNRLDTQDVQLTRILELLEAEYDSK